MSYNKQEEEVDLGSLFTLIGRGISKVFNFFKSILLGVFDLLIGILLFFRKRFIYFLSAIVVGGAIGAFLEFKKQDKYGADMLVQPNFNSSRQLYNNVNYYNDLVKQKDTTQLMKVFNLSEEEAISLKKFEVLPVETENDVVKGYDNVILSVDTLTAKSYSYDQYKKSFTDFDYKFHTILVEATDKKVFSKLGDIVISSVTNNSYFKKVKNLTNENLTRTDSILRQNLTQVDSLRQVYVSVMLEEAKKDFQGTNIDLGSGEKSTTKELQLFDKNKVLNQELVGVVKDRSEKSEVINVISDFQDTGYKIDSIERNWVFLTAVLFFMLTLVFFILKEINQFLINYKK